VATDEELEGQTSIEEALADLGEPWTAPADADPDSDSGEPALF
jgi:hypothetical protein